MQVGIGDKSVLVLDSPATLQEVSVMSSALNDETKRLKKRAQSLVGLDKAQQAIEKPFRTGASSTRRDAAALLKSQQKKEDLRLAEAASEIAITKASALSGKAGRKSLLKTSPTGLAINLGGSSA